LRGVAAEFFALDLPRGHFDGIYANASLFHVPSRALPASCGSFGRRFEDRSFSSIPHGSDQKGGSDGRYGVFHPPESWRGFDRPRAS
jgi:hypothetical protein